MTSDSKESHKSNQFSSEMHSTERQLPLSSNQPIQSYTYKNYHLRRHYSRNIVCEDYLALQRRHLRILRMNFDPNSVEHI